jgi:hypothetical protein
MPPRWNTWAGLQSVQWDWEKQPKERQVRLAGPSPRVGDPVRVRMSGVEIEAVITDANTPVLHVRIKPAALKASVTKTKRTRAG